MSEPSQQQVYSGRYEIVRHLARGGMAEVYLARDQLLDRRVVLKVLSPELARDPSFVRRFRGEAQAAANLSHPGIVAVYDWGEEDGTYFIVMEYVEGPTLREVIQRQGRAHPQRAAQLAAEVAGALAHAHRNGLVHRDVKPGNILISEGEVAKVTDFGIARTGTSEGLTQTGSVMGTATYFSPEQAQGLPVDGRSDIYALGVVLFEMACGVPPFSGDNPISVAYKHVSEAPPLPSDVNPDIPEALEQIILLAMAKDPADRYQSAEELQRDLVAFRRGEEPAAAGMTALVAQVPHATSTMPAGDATTITPRLPGAPSSGSGGDWASGGSRSGPPRSNPWPWVIFLAVLLVLAGGGGLLYQQVLSGGSLTVPAVTDKTVAEARAELERQGFTNVREVPEDNPDVAEGIVFAQEPDAGSKRDPGDLITLKVSAGAASFEMPSVVGDIEADAMATLVNAGLKVVATREPNDEAEEGKVFGTDPPAGETVTRGQTVTIFVAAGGASALVPNVAGDDADAARTELVDAGFKVDEEPESSDTVAKGTVIRTDPAAGDEAPKGSTITLYVSSGPRPTVPNVKGKDQADAEQELEDKGFVPVPIIDESCLPIDDGEVTSQTPAAGTKLDAGEDVTIVVCDSLGPTTTTTT